MNNSRSVETKKPASAEALPDKVTAPGRGARVKQSSGYDDMDLCRLSFHLYKLRPYLIPVITKLWPGHLFLGLSLDRYSQAWSTRLYAIGNHLQIAVTGSAATSKRQPIFFRSNRFNEVFKFHGMR